MPKRSKEDTLITINTIMDAVVDQILRLGYDKMSYTTLSQQTGISRTGISHHFPKKTEFVTALDGRIFKLFTESLDLTGDLDSFVASWLKALDNKDFVSILRLLFHHIAASQTTHEFAGQGLERLTQMVTMKYGAEAERELEWLIGKSIISMSRGGL